MPQTRTLSPALLDRQVSAPLYKLVSTRRGWRAAFCGGGGAAPAVAGRAHAGRPARRAGVDLSEYNFDSPLGRKSLRCALLRACAVVRKSCTAGSSVRGTCFAGSIAKPAMCEAGLDHICSCAPPRLLARRFCRPAKALMCAASLHLHMGEKAKGLPCTVAPIPLAFAGRKCLQ